MTRRDVEEDERFQRELREKINPNWRKQLAIHRKILHVTGPVKMSAWEIKKRATRLNGDEPLTKTLRLTDYLT